MASTLERHAAGSVSARPAGGESLDTRALARELSGAIRGEVRFSPGSRALYANDASVYRQVPIGVVIPRSAEDVVAAVAACRRHGAPIGARGCGTGLAGQTVNEAVMFDFSKYMNGLLELDAERHLARVQPGIVLDWLRDAAEEHALTFGPDPATHSRCTLGGMIGNNSCGVHSIIAGVTADNVLALDVVLYDGTRLTLPCRVEEPELQRVIDRGGREGEIYARLRDLRDRYAELIRERYPQIPRRVSGYNLDRLLPEHGFNLAAALVGTEATCALTLEATCKLIDSPQHRALVVLGYEDSPTGADHVPEIMEFEPIGLETFDKRLVDNELAKGFPERPELLPDGGGWLLVEFGADSEQDADEQAERFVAAMRKAGQARGIKLYEDAREIAEVWKLREGGVGHSKLPGEHPAWPSWEDSAVPPERVGEYLRDVEKLCDKHGRKIAAFYGHVGHGCVHMRIDWDFHTPEGVANYRRFMEDAGDLVASYGGSLSGEHGDGQARAELLPKMFGPELVQAFREFKAIWDPDGMMNPGKVSDPYPLDTNLRMSPTYTTPELHTQFRYPEDGGSFVEAAQRCFGVGQCRDQSETMCPSYMATMEEQHSTRGRARLLFELMRDDGVLEGGWRNEEVKQALDLCLACKGCKHECPVRVDMATYKAEFRSHYWKGRLRPAHAYALGLIYWEARLASRAPRLANLLSQTEPLAALGKRALGIAPERKAPPFASRTFTDWFAAQPPRSSERRALLWPDTFTNHFEPQVAIAATEVLRSAGFEVAIPSRPLCCGRPLYDYGMLTLARRQLRQILGTLREEIRRGTPIVTLEPSCGAVFRDELRNMLPHDEDARRLSELVCTLGELLDRQGEDWRAPTLRRHALAHFHCHQKATADVDADGRVLERLGVSWRDSEAGCCGLAGSFGYERGQPYDVSLKAGEHALLPAVRETPKDTLIVTDGFSCRHQISHASDRRALHLAQVVQMAEREGPGGPSHGLPEDAGWGPAGGA